MESFSCFTLQHIILTILVRLCLGLVCANLLALAFESTVFPSRSISSKNQRLEGVFLSFLRPWYLTLMPWTTWQPVYSLLWTCRNPVPVCAWLSCLTLGRKTSFLIGGLGPEVASRREWMRCAVCCVVLCGAVLCCLCCRKLTSFYVTSARANSGSTLACSIVPCLVQGTS